MTKELVSYWLCCHSSPAILNSPPLLVFLESARMTKCRRKARWQRTRESYQCMNLITTQMAPHNEEKVDVLETLHNPIYWNFIKTIYQFVCNVQLPKIWLGSQLNSFTGNLSLLVMVYTLYWIFMKLIFINLLLYVNELSWPVCPYTRN